MRAWTAFPAMVLIACTALAGLLWQRAAGAGSAEAEPGPRTGMELLQAYRCRPGETKRIILRGVEDNFSVAGEEPARVREGLRTERVMSRIVSRGYDETEPNHWLIDYLETPSRISRGLFVVGLKTLTNAENDLLMLGDASGRGERELLTTRIRDLRTRPGWRRLGAVHYAELDQIRFNNGDSRMVTLAPGTTSTVLEFIHARGGVVPIDVQVQDDTSVDFAGMAVCEQPPAGMGMTFANNAGALDGFVALSCWSVPEGEYICQPSKGDTPCATPLPVACHRNREEPRPMALRTVAAWTGGELKLSEPTPASRFARVGDVDAFCRASFGRDWRVASFHEGLVAGELVARGDQTTVKSRVWVDIQDQPYATCWAH